MTDIETWEQITMSAGGRVIETLPCVVDGEPRVWINTRDLLGATSAIYVERTDAARSISVGDTVRWLGDWAYWTPKAGGFSEWQLARIGGAGALRPTSAAV